MVLPSDREPFALAIKGQSSGTASNSEQLADLLSCPGIPKARVVFRSTGSEPFPIRAEFQTKDASSGASPIDSADLMDRFLRFHVPDMNGLIATAGGDGFAIGMKGQAHHHFAMSLVGASCFPGLRTIELHPTFVRLEGKVPSSYGQFFAVRTEADRMDRLLGGLQLLDHAPIGGGADVHRPALGSGHNPFAVRADRESHDRDIGGNASQLPLAQAFLKPPFPPAPIAKISSPRLLLLQKLLEHEELAGSPLAL